MKKTLAISVVALLSAALVAPPAAAGGAKQVVEGTVALPLVFPLDTNTCYSGVHRRIAILSGEAVNGDFGYHFDTDPKVAGKNFTLEVTGAVGGEPDLDIYFYTKFGTREDVVNDPGGAGAPASVAFATRGSGGESGKVPDKAYIKAIVCMYGGTPGAQASFVYTAGKGVKIPK